MSLYRFNPKEVGAWFKEAVGQFQVPGISVSIFPDTEQPIFVSCNNPNGVSRIIVCAASFEEAFAEVQKQMAKAEKLEASP